MGGEIRRKKGLLGILLHNRGSFMMEIIKGDFYKGKKAQGGFKDDVFAREMHSLKAQKHFSPMFACQKIYRGANTIILA